MIGSCMPDLRHPAQWHPIVVPEGPGCFQCQGLKGFSGVQAIMDTVPSCQIFFVRLLLSDDRSHSEKGKFIRFPAGQPNTNGWFCRRINQFPLVTKSDLQIRSKWILQGSKRPGGIGAGHIWREFSGEQHREGKNPGPCHRVPSLPNFKGWHVGPALAKNVSYVRGCKFSRTCLSLVS